jgi:hypothetical protein
MNDDIAICALEYEISKYRDNAGRDGTIRFRVNGARPVTAANDHIDGGFVVIFVSIIIYVLDQILE